MQNNKEFRNTILFGAVATAAAALICAFLNLWCALLVLVSGTAALLGYIFYTQKRYREIERLNAYLMRVCTGEYDLDIQDNTEGELSILKNNLYKIILLLRSQNAALQKEKLGLADLLADIAHQLKTPFLITADLRNITLDFSAVSDFTFTGDRSWSAEAIGNIVKNCLEHTEDGGKIVFTTEETNIYDMLCIADNGCGIPETELPHIFDRFYHGEGASENSVGIGLALSKSILAREHATIEAKSRVGEGTAFYIKFYKVIV